jgi:hypothetical protein
VAQLSEQVAASHNMKHVMMAVNGNELEMFAIPEPGDFGPGIPLIRCADGCGMKSCLKLDNHVYQSPGSSASYRLVIDFV